MNGTVTSTGSEAEKLKFGPLLTQRLKEKKMSCSKLARLIGVSQPYLHYVLKGEQLPLSVELITAAAAALDVSAYPLLIAAALERGIVPIGGKPETVQRIVARLAHSEIPETVAQQISDLLEAA